MDQISSVATRRLTLQTVMMMISSLMVMMKKKMMKKKMRKIKDWWRMTTRMKGELLNQCPLKVLAGQMKSSHH